MHPTNLTYFLIVYIPLYILTRFGLYKLFKKANVNNAWLAFIPIVCYWPWIKLTGRPKSWFFWALLPAADIIIWFSLVIDLMESFGKFKFWEQVCGVLFPFYMYPKMAYNAQTVYLGECRNSAFRNKYHLNKKGTPRDWADAIFFALVVAYMIRMFQLEPYKIPTSSMEDSMLVGDFLLVSKMNYGPRIPITPVAFPFVHKEFTRGVDAYSEIIKLPYMRLPGFEKLDRNDPIVFNVPNDDNFDPTPRPVDKMENYVKRCVGIPGDKIEIKEGNLYINNQLAYKSPGLQHFYYVKFKGIAPTEDELTNMFDIYDFYRISDKVYTMAISEQTMEKINETFPIEQYLQDMPGKGTRYYNLTENETSSILMYFRNTDTILGGTKVDLSKIYNLLGANYNAIITTQKGQTLAASDFINLGIIYSLPLNKNLDSFYVLMDEKKLLQQTTQKLPKIKSIKSVGFQASYFPYNNQNYPFNKDFYGPIYLPKRGETIKIDATNFYYYEAAIKRYENNPTFELVNNTPYLNGAPVANYTFKYDYYWMMGDNRDNSSDSRVFGYVPENHIVGKPLLVFFSIQYQKVYNQSTNQEEQKFVKFRWNRLFKTIK